MKQISINNKIITYHLERKKVKNINFRFKPDGIIYISANRNVSEKYIIKIITDNAEKFISSLERAKKIQNSKPNPQELLFMGKSYPVEIIYSEKENAELTDNTFRIYTNNNQESNLSKIKKQWQAEQCKELYQKISQEVFNDYKSKGYNVKPSIINIKDMKTRWGSCNALYGKISINLRLIEYPIQCIYSVFYHEYAHYIYQNHSANFYSVLYKMFPDYKKYHCLLKEWGRKDG